eukprot:PLAT14184.3.p1 GENE.PLAT14184.3~~PLAT14184.3.p1  ORF type:complete len:1173 (+),score=598.66 PLAT14184.3:60-3578(+)
MSLPDACDGVVDALFTLIWQKDELDEGPRLHLPDTIVYKFRRPAAWYFTASDGLVKRKRKFHLTNSRIEKSICRGVSDAIGICALFLTNDPDGGSVVEYFTREQFVHFLYNREKPNSGVIQRFVEPKTAYNSMIRVMWSPKVCLIDRRRNLQLLTNKRVGLYERVVTYEGPEHNSETVPIRGSLLPSRLQTACEAVVQHVAGVSFQKYRIARMVLLFKLDPRDRLWLLWCSSLRLDGAVGKKGLAMEMESKMRVPRHIQLGGSVPPLDGDITGDTKTAASASAAAAAAAAASAGMDDAAFECPSCGTAVGSAFKHDVPYKTIITHFEHLLSCLDLRMKVGDTQLLWPPHGSILRKTGGVGFGGISEPIRVEPQYLDIPPVLRKLHPKLDARDYRRYKRDPLFLYKLAPVCEECFLSLAEMVSAPGAGRAKLRRLQVATSSVAKKRSHVDFDWEEIIPMTAPRSKPKPRLPPRRLPPSSAPSLTRRDKGPALPLPIDLDNLPATLARSTMEIEALPSAAPATAPSAAAAAAAAGGGSAAGSAAAAARTGSKTAAGRGRKEAAMWADVSPHDSAFFSTLEREESLFMADLSVAPNLHAAHPLKHMVTSSSTPALAALSLGSPSRRGRKKRAAVATPTGTLGASAGRDPFETLLSGLPDLEGAKADPYAPMRIPGMKSAMKKRKRRKRKPKRLHGVASSPALATTAPSSGDHLAFLRSQLEAVHSDMSKPLLVSEDDDDDDEDEPEHELPRRRHRHDRRPSGPPVADAAAAPPSIAPPSPVASSRKKRREASGSPKRHRRRGSPKRRSPSSPASPSPSHTPATSPKRKRRPKKAGSSKRKAEAEAAARAEAEAEAAAAEAAAAAAAAAEEERKKEEEAEAKALVRAGFSDRLYRGSHRISGQLVLLTVCDVSVDGDGKLQLTAYLPDLSHQAQLIATDEQLKEAMHVPPAFSLTWTGELCRTVLPRMLSLYDAGEAGICLRLIELDSDTREAVGGLPPRGSSPIALDDGVAESKDASADSAADGSRLYRGVRSIGGQPLLITISRASEEQLLVEAYDSSSSYSTFLSIAVSDVPDDDVKALLPLLRMNDSGQLRLDRTLLADEFVLSEEGDRAMVALEKLPGGQLQLRTTYDGKPLCVTIPPDVAKELAGTDWRVAAHAVVEKRLLPYLRLRMAS